MKDIIFVGIQSLLIGTLIGMGIAHKIDKKLIDHLKKIHL